MRIVQEALTFDDVLLLPAHSTVLPKQVQLNTQLTRDINLNIPLVSAAMDTVTEARLAIMIAQEGGIGIIHKNMTVEEQARQVRIVKKFESALMSIKQQVNIYQNDDDYSKDLVVMGISGIVDHQLGHISRFRSCLK